MSPAQDRQVAAPSDHRNIYAFLEAGVAGLGIGAGEEPSRDVVQWCS